MDVFVLLYSYYPLDDYDASPYIIGVFASRERANLGIADHENDDTSRYVYYERDKHYRVECYKVN
jgi:hypothetical protein